MPIINSVKKNILVGTKHAVGRHVIERGKVYLPKQEGQTELKALFHILAPEIQSTLLKQN